MSDEITQSVIRPHYDEEDAPNPSQLCEEHVVTGAATEIVGPANPPATQLARARAISLIGSPEYALAEIAPSPVDLVGGTCDAVEQVVFGPAANVVRVDRSGEGGAVSQRRVQRFLCVCE